MNSRKTESPDQDQQRFQADESTSSFGFLDFEFDGHLLGDADLPRKNTAVRVSRRKASQHAAHTQASLQLVGEWQEIWGRQRPRLRRSWRGGFGLFSGTTRLDIGHVFLITAPNFVFQPPHTFFVFRSNPEEQSMNYTSLKEVFRLPVDSF